MKKIYSAICIILALCFSLASTVQAQTNNVLHIPDVTATLGKTSVLPVYLDNTTRIVGIQFVLTVPEGMTLDTKEVTLETRGEDHIANIKEIENNKYLCMVYSPTNKPLRGYTGKLFDIHFTINNTFVDGSIHLIRLTNVVLGDDDADNVLTSSSIGKLLIANGPDLIVKDIMVAEENIEPTDTINISWLVTNDSELPTLGGWKEQIHLVKEDGTRALIGTVYNDAILDGNGHTARSASFKLPQAIGLDGTARIQVKVIANADAGESISAAANNTAVSDATVNVGKQLFVELPTIGVDENSKSLVKCKLLRSGSWAAAETFTLSKTADDRVDLPATVTISKGQSATYFYMKMVDNEVLDDDSVVTISASGNGYEEVKAQLIVVDNEYPDLTIAAPKYEIAEGENFQLQISVERVSSKPVTLYLTCDRAEHFKYPAQVILPAGAESVTVDVTAIEDNLPNVTLDAAFAVKASRYNSSECYIELLDNDLPEIALTLTPNAISESAGPTAIMATLKRLTHNDNKVTVKLSDDSNNRLYYSTQTIVLESGVSEAQFTIGAIDNALVDGEQEITVTAAIYISSCDCAASGTTAGVVAQMIKVLDDDGPALQLASSKSMLLEGAEEGTVLTVTRNTDTTKPLTVTLTSDADDMLTYEKTVTIPAGKVSASVTVAAMANDTSSDSRTVVFTAKADNYTSGTCWAMITDQTLPDAVVTAVSPATNQIVVGDTVEVSVTVGNEGIATLAAPAKVSLYLSNSSAALVTFYTQENLAPGSTVTLTKKVAFPTVVGSYKLRAVVNESQSTKELLYINNTLDNVSITMLPAFTAAVTTDKKIYKQGEAVNISGAITGKNTANAEVEVYIINSGIRQTLSVTTDATGKFSTTWQPYSGQMGHFVVGACYPNEKQTTELANFDIYGLKRTSNSYITCETLVGEPYNGTITLTNPGELPLTGVKVEVLSAPEHCKVTTQLQTEIAGGNHATLSYTLTNDEVSSGDDWEEIKLRVTTSEGASLDVTLYHFCRSPKGKLQASISAINTTMIKGASRDYSFTIVNQGKGATGKISLALPNVSWMKAVTPIEMTSLAYGETATIVLRLTPTEDMQLNVPVTGRVGINCENGDGIPLNYRIEPVSESTGTLTIDVCDEYTYYTAEAPHVAGAEVLVKHPVTGAVVAKGLTGEDGKFSVELPEGYYTVSVTADKHDSYQNNILVDPGVETPVDVFLSFQAITYSWDVVETEVEDEYKIETIIKYETNVPTPVVEVIYPQSIPCKNHIFYITATNKGLLPAYNVEPILPKSDKYMSFECLGKSRIETLLPQSSAIFAVQVIAKQDDVNGGDAGIGYGDSGKPDDSNDNSSGGSDGGSDGGSSDESDGGSSDESDGGSNEGSDGESSDGSDNSSTCVCFDKQISIKWEARICNKKTGEWIYVQKSSTRSYKYCVGQCPSSGGSSIPKYFVGVGDGGAPGGLAGGHGGILGGGGSNGSSSPQTFKPSRHIDNCIPCIPNLFKRLFNCGKELFPVLDCAEKTKDAIDSSDSGSRTDAIWCWAGEIQKHLGCLLPVAECFENAKTQEGTLSNQQKKDCIMDVLENCGGAVSSPIKWAVRIKKCWDIFKTPCDDEKTQEARAMTRESSISAPSYINAFYNNTIQAIEELSAYGTMFVEIFGDSLWSECDMSELKLFLAAEKRMSTDNLEEKVELLLPYCPTNITKDYLTKYIERSINTEKQNNGISVNSDNVVNYEIIDNCINIIVAAEKKAVELGYTSSYELLQKELDSLEKRLEESSNAICASITLQLSQTMTMTRQAFRGTLTVFNGHETIAMEDVRLSLEVRDEDGTLATAHEFQINAENLDKFDGQLSLDAGWSLAANETGVATILFIPTKYAAPTEAKEYSFGGTLSYIDPFTGLEVTRDLYPVTLTVKPSPNLEMTYFMQRDIFGDDPLTTDVVEPMEPAEFSLLINNVGYGDATNARMVTEQPKIIENEKGLFIDFELLSSQLNGGEQTLALGGSVPTEFGTIPAHSTAYVQWWIQSTLLGHFTEYDIKATHVTSYGNEDLSLLDTVTIHELIRSIKVPVEENKVLTGFLVNDITDAEDMPDMLYLSDGVIESVNVTTEATISKNSDTEYLLTVTPLQAGWNYGSLVDPTYGKQDIVRIVRLSDGAEINLRNIWQTDRTLRDGKDPLYESRIHFVDKFGATEESYQLTFEPKPDKVLEVESFVGVPASDVVVKDALKEVTVCFNKPIDAATFTTRDLTLNCQGKAQDVSQIVITQVSNTEYKLDISALSAFNGYYVLTVQTAGIVDDEGFVGESGKTASWVQYVGGKANLMIKVIPNAAGTVAPAAGLYDYEETVALAATANEGYEFLSWSSNDEVIATMPTHEYLMEGDVVITATFAPKNYNVEIVCDVNEGVVTGAGTGVYPYGNALTLTAEPLNGYIFDGWYIADSKVAESSTFVHTVDSAVQIEARFTQVIYDLTLRLENGWNWISAYFADEELMTSWKFFAPIKSGIERVVGMEKEIVNDPEYGLTGNLFTLSPTEGYKVKTNRLMLNTWTGVKANTNSTQIALKKGWNWIGYPVAIEMEVNEVFANAEPDNEDYIVGQDGFAQYTGGEWIGTLETLETGKGYMYYSKSDKEFAYNTAIYAKSQSMYRSPVIEEVPWDVNKYKYPNIMCMIAELFVDETIIDMENCLVGAFCGKECRGIGKYVGGKVMMSVYGNNNEDITFRVKDSKTQKMYNVMESITFKETLLGSVNQPYPLHISDATDVLHMRSALKVSIEGGNLYIYLNGKSFDSVMLTDVYGNTALSVDDVSQGEAIHVAMLPDGVYIVTAMQRDAIYNKKVIKVNQ